MYCGSMPAAFARSPELHASPSRRRTSRTSRTATSAQFAIAAVAALGLLGFGGVFLARKFAVPVEATVERMREFMSDAAHELRTPVAVLRTESEVALARARDGVQDHAAFQRIAGDAARLAAVVDDLFTLARAESGELAIEHLSLFLDDLVSDAVSSFATVATQRGVVLALGDFDEAPVMGSALLLRRLVGILLDNAIKYSGRGTRTVVSISATATAVAVTVADTGAGISAAALPRICDRFFRGDDARAAAPGAGLGLAIAVRIAELHHGTLVIESDVGRGTIARFSMPRRLGIRSDLSAEPATM
jgi:signal transduction histidine kinase